MIHKAQEKDDVEAAMLAYSMLICQDDLEAAANMISPRGIIREGYNDDLVVDNIAPEFPNVQRMRPLSGRSFKKNYKPEVRRNFEVVSAKIALTPRSEGAIEYCPKHQTVEKSTPARVNPVQTKRHELPVDFTVAVNGIAASKFNRPRSNSGVRK